MELGSRLWNARVNRASVAVDDDTRPADAGAAYVVQAAMMAAADSPIIGYKIGATAEASMNVLGLDEPFQGPLFEAYRYANATDVAINPDDGPRLETEFVVGLGADLPARAEPYEPAEIQRALAWIGAGFEIVGTRYETDLPGAGLLLIADGGANVGYIEGPRTTEVDRIDLASHEATLRINGETIATGNAGMSLWGHALGAVGWLCGHASLGGRGLAAGDVIMTGTCTGLTPISPGDEAHADFGSLGELKSRFVAA